MYSTLCGTVRTFLLLTRVMSADILLTRVLSTDSILLTRGKVLTAYC
jgi:hypothetical protein